MLQKIWNTCTNPTGRDRSMKCPNHPEKIIVSFCMIAECDTPYMCHLCESSHSQSHMSEKIPIKQLFKGEKNPIRTDNINEFF